MSDSILYLSIIIVFLTVYYDILSKDISTFISKKVWGRNAQKSRDLYRRELTIISIKSIALSAFYLVIAYLLIPETVFIIKNSQINLIEFDLKNSLFVFLEIFILVFMILSFEMLVKIIRKIITFLKKS